MWQDNDGLKALGRRLLGGLVGGVALRECAVRQIAQAQGHDRLQFWDALEEAAAAVVDEDLHAQVCPGDDWACCGSGCIHEGRAHRLAVAACRID